MPRHIRIEFPGALYHVTARGDRREDIFDDDADRNAFLDIFAEVVAQARYARFVAECTNQQIKVNGSVSLIVLSRTLTNGV